MKDLDIGSKAGTLALAAAIDKGLELGAAEGRCLTLKESPPLHLVTRLMIDDCPKETRAIAAMKRITGSVIVGLPTANSGVRMWGGRWRYLAPTLSSDGMRITGRPSISPVERLRVHCKKCGAYTAKFFDAVKTELRAKNQVTCGACGSPDTVRDRIKLTCMPGKGLADGFDNLLEDTAYPAEELEALTYTHKGGMHEDLQLTLPRLWVGYAKPPQDGFVAEDNDAQQLLAAAEAKGLYMRPFDLVYAAHRDGTATQPIVQCNLECTSVAGNGWVDMNALEGRTRSAWTQHWVTLPPPREERSTAPRRQKGIDL